MATLTFDSTKIEKTGSKESPKHTYRFTSETGIDFVLPCLSDSGNARTLVAKDLLDEKGIKYYEADANEHLFDPKGGDIHINGCVMLIATFKNESIYVDALVSDDISQEIIVSCHDSERIGAISITPDEWPSTLSVCNIARLCAIREGVLPNLNLSEEDIQRKIDFYCEKYSCLRDKLPEDSPFMDGPPMIIQLKDNVPLNPPKCLTAPTLPQAYEKPARELFDELEAGGQIEKVPLSQKIKFCSRGFIVPKGGHISNGARLVVDFSNYCKYILRPVHCFVPGSDILKKLDPTAVVFAKVDCLHGYFQIRLAKESRYLTTFVSPFGTFWYNVAPMGIPSSSDEWNKRSDAALAGLEGVYKLVDDVLVAAPDYDTLFKRLEAVFEACVKNNITLKKSKFEIGTEVTFSGFIVSSDGIRPTEDRIMCIKNFPVPTSRKTLKSFLGTARYIAHFVPDLAMVEGPLRQLDRAHVSFIWTDVHQRAFEEIKTILTGPLVLRNFDSARPTRLETDASRLGLGFALLQQDPETNNWHLIQCGSRGLTDPESRYAVCELEMLSICWSLIKSRHWILGYDDLEVVTDHSSLVGVFNKQISELNNPRLIRLRERCLEFTFRVTWRRGVLNQLADMLSRFPVWPPNDELADPNFKHVCNMIKNGDTDPLLDPLITAAKQDSSYKKLIEAIKTYMTASKIPKYHPAREYSKKWRDLSVHSTGLVVLELTRIVIPESCRKDVLKKFHVSHCGQSKLKALAKQRFYWPGLNNSLDQIVKNCEKCRPLLPSQQQQPIIPSTDAMWPMSHVGSDLFSIDNNTYICLIDRYSGWPMVAKLRSTTTEAVIKVLYDWYTTWGWPCR